MDRHGWVHFIWCHTLVKVTLPTYIFQSREVLLSKTNLILTVVDVVGSVHWQPAEFGPQSTVGCCSWFSTCLCSYADEIVSGESSKFFFFYETLVSRLKYR